MLGMVLYESEFANYLPNWFCDLKKPQDKIRLLTGCQLASSYAWSKKDNMVSSTNALQII